MQTHATVVLDVGKTLTKASLWGPTGMLVERRCRPNARPEAGGYLTLDAAGIEEWLATALREFSQMQRIGHIIPVGHGAAAALVREGKLHAPPLDYEYPIPAAIHREYDEQREPFRLTGSPALPAGLNLGAQLHFLERVQPELWKGEPTLLPWPQYWSWRLSGRAASEVTSLGCHTDLWYPLAAGYSRTAMDRGWAARFAPLTRADAVGPILAEWTERSGLPADVGVLCGLHDSNAALLAARTAAGAEQGDMTVLSTGTWFVAMRTPSSGRTTLPADLPADRDCLVNVDLNGEPVPSARFMGGREIEILMGDDGPRADTKDDDADQVAAAGAVIAKGAMILPTFAAGAGPYGQCSGRWLSMPADPLQRWAAVCLYAALLSDTMLELVGSRDCLIIEGRFAAATLFVAGLAALRPEMAVYAAPSSIDVSLGALTLLQPTLPVGGSLARARPLKVQVNDYRKRWRQECLRQV